MAGDGDESRRRPGRLAAVEAVHQVARAPNSPASIESRAVTLAPRARLTPAEITSSSPSANT